MNVEAFRAAAELHVEIDSCGFPADVLALLDEVERLRATVARVEALAEAADASVEASLSRTFNGGRFPAQVTTGAIRRALNAEATQCLF